MFRLHWEQVDMRTEISCRILEQNLPRDDFYLYLHAFLSTYDDLLQLIYDYDKDFYLAMMMDENIATIGEIAAHHLKPIDDALDAIEDLD